MHVAQLRPAGLFVHILDSEYFAQDQQRTRSLRDLEKYLMQQLAEIFNQVISYDS